jgi:hypothetical protein
VHSDIIDVVSENTRAACARINKPHQNLQRRRFARAVCAEKAEDFAALNGQRKIVKRTHFALAPEADFIVLRQIFNLDNRRHSLKSY